MKILYVDCDKCDAQICSCKDLELSPAEKIAALRDALKELGVDIEEIIAEITRRGQNFYCESLRIASAAPCLGWEAKVKAGEFGEDEMSAHAQHHLNMGMHRGLLEAVRIIREKMPLPKPPVTK
jgi:hypothetical protein